MIWYFFCFFLVEQLICFLIIFAVNYCHQGHPCAFGLKCHCISDSHSSLMLYHRHALFRLRMNFMLQLFHSTRHQINYWSHLCVLYHHIIALLISFVFRHLLLHMNCTLLLMHALLGSHTTSPSWKFKNLKGNFCDFNECMENDSRLELRWVVEVKCLPRKMIL